MSTTTKIAPPADGPNYYLWLKELSKELGRPVCTLVALAEINDPFYANIPSRRRGAEWFAGLWYQFNFGLGTHIRRVHYRIISQESPILLPGGEDYENTEKCWQLLVDSSRDARYLGLVPAAYFVDRRHNETVINLQPTGWADADLDTIDDFSEIGFPSLPRLEVSPPIVPQRYHLEIICEKSTIDDVLDPLGRKYQINVTSLTGEISETRCRQIVERARRSGRPCRILYISDFDPAGQSMPVAASRKIEFELAKKGLKLDIQLRPVALSHEQCQHYELPRTPLKDSEKRADRFERRFGEGATELDAMEALHPGELRSILETEIERYYDSGLEDEIDDIAQNLNADIDDVNNSIHESFANEIQALEEEYAALEKRRKIVWHAVEEKLKNEAPVIDEVIWPEPCDGDEDDDPLYDSTRGYVEQMDRYKAFQGKPTVGRPKGPNPDGRNPKPKERTKLTFPPEIMEKVCEMRAAGKTLNEISKATGISVSSVHRILNRE
jgi:hypothetical protein